MGRQQLPYNTFSARLGRRPSFAVLNAFWLDWWPRAMSLVLQSLRFKDVQAYQQQWLEDEPRQVSHVLSDSLRAKLIEAIQDRYPSQLHQTILMTIHRHLDLKILGVMNSSRLPVENAAKCLSGAEANQQLWFAPRAADHLVHIGQKAVAHWLNLDVLLYGQRIRTADIRYLLQLPKNVSLSQFINERYYTPLLSELQKSSMPEA